MNNHATLRAEHEIDGWQMTPPPLTTNDLCQGGPLSTARCCVMVQGKTQRLHFSGILTSSVLRRPPLVSSNDRAKRRPQKSALSERLFRDYPKAFNYPPVPLAVGIGLKLHELLGAEFKPADIRAFLHAWTSGPRYLKGVARGEVRRNLDGSPAGLPESKHRADARERLNAMRRSGN
jgi:hypothetical protein